MSPARSSWARARGSAGLSPALLRAFQRCQHRQQMKQRQRKGQPLLSRRDFLRWITSAAERRLGVRRHRHSASAGEWGDRRSVRLMKSQGRLRRAPCHDREVSSLLPAEESERRHGYHILTKHSSCWRALILPGERTASQPGACTAAAKRLEQRGWASRRPLRPCESAPLDGQGHRERRVGRGEACFLRSSEAVQETHFAVQRQEGIQVPAWPAMLEPESPRCEGSEHCTRRPANHGSFSSRRPLSGVLRAGKVGS
jgi:hypothetical protein